MENRDLSEKQHKALDRIDRTNPEARVIGWDYLNHGPIIETIVAGVKHAKVLGTLGYLRNLT